MRTGSELKPIPLRPANAQTLAQQNGTYRNAVHIDGWIRRANDEPPAPLLKIESELGLQKEHKGFIQKGLLGLLVGVLGGIGLAGYGYHKTYQDGTLTTPWHKLKADEGHPTLFIGSFLTILCGVMGLYPAYEFAQYRGKIQESLRLARKYRHQALRVQPESCRTAQKVAAFLSTRNQAMMQELAERIAAAKATRPADADPEHFKVIDELTQPAAVRDLFRYMAFQWVSRGEAPQEGTRTVGELAFETSLCALLQIALNTGTIFEAVTPDQSGPFSERFNAAMVPTMTMVEETLRHRLKTVLSQFERQVELEQLLEEVELAMKPYLASQSDPPPELTRMHDKLERLKQIKAENQAALDRIDLEATPVFSPLDNPIMIENRARLAAADSALSEFLAANAAETVLEQLIEKESQLAARHES
jgi:hypothetical protein